MTDAPVAAYVDDRLSHWAGRRPDDEAMTYLGRSWTWAQWDDRVRRAAGALAGLGVGRGDVVAVLDQNHPAGVEITLAAGSLGAANAVVDRRLSPDRIGDVIDDAGARVVVVGTALLPSIETVRDRLTGVERIVEVTPEGGDGDEYERLLAAAEPTSRPGTTEPDDVCLVLYSSDATGCPSGVMLTHANLVEHAVNAHEGWGLEPGDKSMVSMPLAHVAGSSYALLGIHDGVPSILTRDPEAASLAGAILGGADRAFLEPAVLDRALRAGPEAVAVFGKLKSVGYGSPMPLPLLRAVLAAWPETDFIGVYARAEVAGAVTHLSPDDHRDALAEGREHRLRSAGKPLPGCEVRVADPVTGKEVAVGDRGELWLRTAQLMKGLLGREEETRRVVTGDGWFRTGDLGRVDDDGYVYVEGRLAGAD